MGLTAYNKRRRMALKETVEEKPVQQEKHTKESLKMLDYKALGAICKELAIQGYTTKSTQARIDLILENQ